VGELPVANNIVATCKHELAMRIIAILKQECIDNVPDLPNKKLSTKVNVIGLRKVIGDNRISLTVQHFHPTQREQWSNEIVGSRDALAVDGLRFPAKMVGGDTFLRFKLAIQLKANLSSTGETPEQADGVIQEVISRTVWAIIHHGDQLINIQDKYGIRTYEVTVVGDAEYDSGAENANNTIAWIKVSVMAMRKGKQKEQTNE
jgi:hypothetical protein